MRDGESPRLFLQSIITNRGSGNQCFLKITLFKNIELFMSTVCPDACIAISLQLQTHLQLILFGFSQYLLFRHLHLRQGTFHVLYVVADLMRQDIGLGEIATCTMFVFQVCEKPKVHVNLLIFRAIKGPHASTGRPASTGGRAAVEYKRRGRIAAAGLGKYFRPDSLCIRQYGPDKRGLLIIHFFINDFVATTTQKRQVNEATKIGHCTNPQNDKAEPGTKESFDNGPNE